MQFSSKPIVEHNEVPLPDEGRLEEILEHWQQRNKTVTPTTNKQYQQNPKGNACYVVSVVSPDDSHPEGKLAEILGLVKVHGDRVLGHEIYTLHQPNPKTFLGQGISREIVLRANELGADMLVLDAQLTPSQARNLENMAGIAICDREAVILNVFLRHAKTRNARNQVEIAHLKYLRPRIRGLGLNMDQQAGGIMRGRGPGETASELVARQLDARLLQLTRAAKKQAEAGRSQRKSRSSCKCISLIGYTNAGKTSIMNALTAANLTARDVPFETLDTTTRALCRNAGSDVVLSDTVGFIRDLPDHLLASFESTLAQTIEANLLVIVVDASDPESTLHLDTTEALLTKLGADKVPRFYLFNKCDKLDTPLSADLCRLLSRGNHYLTLSSFDDDAMLKLRTTLIETVREKQQQATLFVPYTARNIISKLYADCRVIEITNDNEGSHFVVEGEVSRIERLQRMCQEVQQ
jgi:GTPase